MVELAELIELAQKLESLQKGIKETSESLCNLLITEFLSKIKEFGFKAVEYDIAYKDFCYENEYDVERREYGDLSFDDKTLYRDYDFLYSHNQNSIDFLLSVKCLGKTQEVRELKAKLAKKFLQEITKNSTVKFVVEF